MKLRLVHWILLPKLDLKDEIRVWNSSNWRITRSHTHNNWLDDNEVEKQGESVPPTPTMASRPPDSPPMTLIMSTLSIVQPVGLPSVALMVVFPSFDGNPNQDSRMHVQSFLNAAVMSLVNDDGYSLLWIFSTLKDKALEWFWSNPTVFFSYMGLY